MKYKPLTKMLRGLHNNYKNLTHRRNIYKYLKKGRIPWSQGYNEYKMDYIGNVIKGDALKHFYNKSLPERYGFRLDERVVEYPWFFSRLKNNERVILDAGSTLSFEQILENDKLNGKRLYIISLAHEKLISKHKTSYIIEDIRATCFRDNFFDAICSISTIEHVGMDNTLLYTDDIRKKENDKYAYLSAIRELRRILKKGGTLYITVPFGLYKNYGWFQVFDSEMISHAINEFVPVSYNKTFFKYHDDRWNFSTEEECRDGDCFDVQTMKEFKADYLAFSRCISCLELQK